MRDNLKNIAVIGAGFSGLGIAFHCLKQGHQVTLFDGGDGASSASSGLMNPYPGDSCKRSWRATEGLLETIHLVEESERCLGKGVAHFSGIEKRFEDEVAAEKFWEMVRGNGDVERMEPLRFLITSGLTINPLEYLKGLSMACQALGATIRSSRIDDLEELRGFDQIVLACGDGLFSFVTTIPLFRTKGQMLICKFPEETNFERTIVGEGHLSSAGPDGHLLLGSTYERVFSSDEPDIEKTKKALLPNLATIDPSIELPSVVGCKAGVRLTRKGHYFPVVSHQDDRVWIVTGMGSRGLLYHALVGKWVAQAISEEDVKIIPKEVYFERKS